MEIHGLIILHRRQHRFPGELAAQRGVDVIPMSLELGGRTTVYVPGGGDITPEDFYAALRAKKPAYTSQINPQVYAQSFERHLREGKDVVYLCFSSGISATIQAARLAAQELEEKSPRAGRCVDSLCARWGGVHRSRRSPKRGEGNVLDACALVEEKAGRWFMVHVDDLEALNGAAGSGRRRMGGRCDQAVLPRRAGLSSVEKVRGRPFALAMAEPWTRRGRGRRAGRPLGHGDAPVTGFLAARVLEAPGGEVSEAIGPVSAHTRDGGGGAFLGARGDKQRAQQYGGQFSPSGAFFCGYGGGAFLRCGGRRADAP
jgi:hypothetical protein